MLNYIVLASATFSVAVVFPMVVVIVLIGLSAMMGVSQILVLMGI